MEEEIKDALEKIYIIPIDVEFIEFRVYNIVGTIYKYNENKDDYFEIRYVYDNKLTQEANVNEIVQRIDREIVRSYRKARV